MKKREVHSVENSLTWALVSQLLGSNRQSDQSPTLGGAPGSENQCATPPRLGLETLADTENPSPLQGSTGQIVYCAEACHRPKAGLR